MWTGFLQANSPNHCWYCPFCEAGNNGRVSLFSECVSPKFYRWDVPTWNPINMKLINPFCPLLVNLLGGFLPPRHLCHRAISVRKKKFIYHDTTSHVTIKSSELSAFSTIYESAPVLCSWWEVDFTWVGNHFFLFTYFITQTHTRKMWTKEHRM